MTHVADDSHDFAHGLLTRHDREIVRDAAADRVVIRPEAAGHRFIDDDDAPRVRPVTLREPTPGFERYADDGEVVAADDVQRGGGPLDRWNRRLTGNRERAFV